MKKLGLIAGSGKYPLYLIREIRKTGTMVVVFGLKGEAEKTLDDEADKIYHMGMGQVGKFIKICKLEGISEVIMAGRMGHTNIFRNLKLDKRALGILMRVKDKRANSLIRGVAEELEKDGIKLVDSIAYMSPYLVPPGVLTSRKLSKKEKEDIEFGFRTAKAIAGHDIGQTVVVKDRAVLAVEAMEGTDETMRRGGRIGGNGAVVVKVSKPDQDRRFDLPVLGMNTVKTAEESGVGVIAFSAGMTLLLDREEMVKACNDSRITLFAIDDPGVKKK